MVALSASGDILTLKAAGSVKADGWFRADGKGAVTGDILFDLSLCHGFTGAIGAEITATAEGRLGALWFLAAGGQLDANAQAVAFARGTLSGNVFDDFGAVIGLGASAGASASVEAHAGLDVLVVAELAEAVFGRGFMLDMFRAFLNEVRIEGGFRASAWAAAAARVVVGLSGNLLESPARFDIEVEQDAAAGTGAGMSAFFRCEIADPRRMALTMSELATSEIVSTVRSHIPEPMHVLLDWFDLLAPATTAVVWEVAQQTVPSMFSADAGEQCADKVVSGLLGRLQSMLLDRIVEAGFAQVKFLLQSAVSQARLATDQATLDALADTVRALADGYPPTT
jgi:hypothetical protein